MRVYLDASPIIYLVEQVAPFITKVLARLAVPDIVVVSSDLARMEALIRPLRNKDVALVGRLDLRFRLEERFLKHLTGRRFNHA